MSAKKLIRTTVLPTNYRVGRQYRTAAARLLTLFIVALLCLLGPPAQAVAGAAGATASPVEDKWAVVIDLSEFADSSVPKLKYSAKDAKDFA